MQVFLYDPGSPRQCIEVSEDLSSEGFIALLEEKGANYTCAHSKDPRFRAWRPLGGSWQEGTLRQALQKVAKHPLPTLVNMRMVADAVDEGVTLEEIADDFDRGWEERVLQWEERVPQ